MCCNGQIWQKKIKMQLEEEMLDVYMSDVRPIDGDILRFIADLGLYRRLDGSLRKLRDRIQCITDTTYRNFTCYSEIDYLFIKRFLNVPHPFGITLSTEIIGSDCHIAQNCTIGTNGKEQSFDAGTEGFRPQLGFCVKVNPGAIISGPIEVGSFSVVYGNSTLTKSVPPFSVVRGMNLVEPMKHMQQYKALAHCLYHSLVVSKRPPAGLAWSSSGLLVSERWRTVQQQFIECYKDGKLKNGLVEFFEQQKRTFQCPIASL